MRLLLIFVVSFIFSTGLKSQVSLVPASHQVYEWLHLQRVKGNITNYSYEALPLTRKQINGFLQQVENSGKLNGIDSRLLKWYKQEFSVEQLEIDAKETYLQGWEDDILSSAKSKLEFLFSDKEPHLFVFFTDSIHWVVDYSFGGGTLIIDDPLNNYTQAADITYKTLRTYGTIYNTLGAHAEISNPYSFTAGQFRYHPEWGQTFDGRQDGKLSTVYAEAFATFSYKQLGVHIGNGDLIIGNRGNEAPILRQEAGNFDWVRVNFDSKYFQYTFLHGALSTEPTQVTLEGFPGVISRVSPQKWFALRRIQLTPAPWISMAFTESLTYSNRPIELTYLNPLFPLRLGEFETNDKDNPIWFFDGTIRPLRNLELYSTIGIDDLWSFSDIFVPTNKRDTDVSVVSYQFGMNLTLPTSTILNAEFSQIDPYFYTHKFYLNTYSDFDSPLGPSIGPNSRQYFISIRQWLPWRSFFEFSLANAKKGYNIVDSNGFLLQDVGGDLFEGRQTSGEDTVLLFSGDIHRWNTFRVQFEIEPFRGIKVFADYRKRMMIEGGQIGDFNMLLGGLEVYFYPGVQRFINKIPIVNKAF